MRELEIHRTKSEIEQALKTKLNLKEVSKPFEFISRAYIFKEAFPKIAFDLNENQTLLTKWNKDLEPIWRNVTNVKSIHSRKQMNIDNFWDFYEWYNSKDKCCQYCGITENQLNLLNSESDIINKRNRTRGRTLEIDRKISSEDYNNLENLAWSCYWCNNAKTDTFTAEEFQEIGKAIGEVWKKRLANAHR